MNLSAILAFFEQSMLIGMVGIIVYLTIISRDMKHIRETLKDIKGTLNNHITDTNKKIDELRIDTNNKIDRLSDRFDRLYELLIKKERKTP